MKKITILSAPLLLVCLIFLFTSVSLSVEGKSKSRFVGTWTQCDKNGNVLSMVDGKTIGEYKVITRDQFLVYQSDMKIAAMIFSGSWRVDGDIYSETIRISIPTMVSENGVVNSFRFKFIKGLLYVEGTNNNYNQIWKKITPFIN